MRAGEREHHEAADHQQHVAHRHRRARADHRLEHRGVVGQARDHLAGARQLEVARRQREQVVEHRAPQVGGDALAQPRHEVEARVGGDRHHHDHAEHERERAVELGAAAGDEAAVDHELEALPDREHRRRGEEQRDRRERRPAAGTGRTKRPTRASVRSAVSGGSLGASSGIGE